MRARWNSFRRKGNTTWTGIAPAARFDPAEAVARGGRCPVCGKRVTVGVLHRVEALADREEGKARPPTAGAVIGLVPLPEFLSEILRAGVATQGVTRAYDRVTAALGPDFTVLEHTPIEDIGRVHPLLGTAVSRLRAGRVLREAGYDGRYGAIRLLEAGEIDRLMRGKSSSDASLPRRPHAKATSAAAGTAKQRLRRKP